MSRAVEESNRRLLRARDAMDRAYAEPLDIPALARIAHVSEAHFNRTFRVTFGETPHRYLQRRRVERAMFLLRETGRSVTEICFQVGFGTTMSAETAQQVRELVTKGATGGNLIFRTDDCQKTYETLVARGVEFTEEPTERPYGIDCGLRDPFGTHIRFTQLKE
ncbi:MAG TPA: helix-turn-helix domain-containing protein [Actinoplanes sp.]